MLSTVPMIRCHAPGQTCIRGGQSTSEQRSVSATSPSLMPSIAVIDVKLSLLRPISHLSVSFVCR